MKNLKKEKAITLIALVITIIVLIILAGVSINLVLGNDGIITKAREARENTVVGLKKEQVELAYVSAAVKKLGDSVTDTDLQTELNSSVGNGKTKVTGSKILSVHFYETDHNYTVNNGTVSKATDGENNIVNTNGIREVTVYEGYAYVLKDTGDLVKFYYYDKEEGHAPSDGEYIKYDDKFETKIAEGVVKVQNIEGIIGNELYYLTTTNALYNYKGETSKTIASGVKEFKGEKIKVLGAELYYLTTTNDLCVYNQMEDTTKTIASGVKEFKGKYYLTTTNDLYYYNMSKEATTTIASGVKEFNDNGHYLTTTNDLCVYNPMVGKSITIASGVKVFNEFGLYLTTINDLCYYNGETSKTIANGVKEFNNNGYYLNTTNDLCYYDMDEETTKTIASGVKEFKIFNNNNGIFVNNGALYYLTTANDLCVYNPMKGTSKTIASGVTRYGDKWYELNEEDVYIQYQRIQVPE